MHPLATAVLCSFLLRIKMKYSKNGLNQVLFLHMITNTCQGLSFLYSVYVCIDQ